MSLLVPGALILGLLAAPIILLYMLKLRRRDQVVSSTLLWQELVKDRTANAPWQRLRRNLLLLLQLLILAMLVLALARPYWQSSRGANGNLIVLLDSSASMQATDGEAGASRFVDAKAEVERLIDGLNIGDQMTLVLVGRTPSVPIAMTNDRPLLRQALKQAEPENGSADWASAFILAATTSQGLIDPRIVIISDGGLPETLPALPGEVAFIPVGRSDENLAITAMATRPAGEARDLLVSVANKGQSPGQAVLSLYIDNMLFDSQRIGIGADQASHLSWSVPAKANMIEGRLEAMTGTIDHLAIDNQAWAISGGQATHRVLLVSEENLFLERFFAIMPGYELVRVPKSDIEQWPEAGGEFDLYIFDGVTIPEQLPTGSILIINPQPGTGTEGPHPAIQVTGSFTETAITRLADDPLLTNVDWQAINIAEAQFVSAPGLATLVASETGPLVLAGEIDGRRVALLTFDLHRSDLPLQIAFPVIMANIVDWLNPGRVVAAEESPQPGAVVTLIPNARAESIAITHPDGTVTEISRQESGAPILFNDTQQIGVYTVSYRINSGEIRSEQFAINFFNPEESRIKPSDSVYIGSSEIVSDSDGFIRRWELWPYLLLAGLCILMIEWWATYQRGIRRPPFLKFK